MKMMRGEGKNRCTPGTAWAGFQGNAERCRGRTRRGVRRREFTMTIGIGVELESGTGETFPF